MVMASCRDEPVSNSTPPPPSTKGVYVLNEGLFGQGNSTLSYFDLETLQVYNDVFFTVNNRHLGDVGNSIALRGNLGYIVVNNSNKIEIIDIRTNLSAGKIDIGAGRSPRQLAFVNDTLGLVTNLFDASVVVVDLKNKSILQRIDVGQNPDGIAIAGGKAFVANSGLGSGRTISVINVGTFTTVRTIVVGDNPVEIQVTPGGLVYILCAGFYSGAQSPDDATPAKIFVMQPLSETIVDSILIGGHAFKIAMGSNDLAYVPTTDSVLALDTRFHRVLGTFARGDFYGVAVDTTTGDVYLSDPRDYTVPGTVYQYASNGQVRRQFDVGIIPGSFAFKRQ
jgi:DNA-binding beta-propeller fold protein YncE